MGVHQSPEVYNQIKELLDIPKDEPIFIFRAQDEFSLHSLVEYRNMARNYRIINKISEDWFSDLAHIIDDFVNWRNENSDKVKVPD